MKINLISKYIFIILIIQIQIFTKLQRKPKFHNKLRNNDKLNQNRLQLENDQILLKPKKENEKLKQIVVIIIQGAELSNTSYKNLGEKIIEKNPEYNIWVGIPNFFYSTPNPILLKSKINNILNFIKSQNHSIENVFLVGHSLATVMLQSFINKYNDIKKDLNGDNFKGLVLMGGPILRSYRELTDIGKSKFNLKLPTLTISAELDGLARITRFAESFWHIKNNWLDKKEVYERFPHILIKGMNHSQFANGDTTSLILKNDLKPEIDNEEAVEKTSNIINLFINSFFEKNEKDKKNQNNLNELIEETENDLSLFLEAFNLEGNINLKPPCYGHELINVENSQCFHGSPISNMAQQIMAGLPENFTIDNDDNFHRVYSVNPVHLPKITNNCDPVQNITENKIGGNSEVCNLKSITVSQPINLDADYLDTSFYSNVAQEIRVKLSSRQNFHCHANLECSNFHELDEISTCGAINQQILDLIKKKIPKNVLARFEEFGQNLVIGEDLGPYNAGPLWIWKSLTYTEKEQENQNSYILVQSPTMRTPLDYYVSSAAGFHYCKILSPAYIVEWIYLDGLRKYMTLNSVNDITLEEI